MNSKTTLEFDPEALRNRYAEERDKRLRSDGNEQYVEMTGDYAHYLDDPYVEEALAVSYTHLTLPTKA